MLVVREKEDLGLAGKVAQNLKSCGGTAVVVIDEQVIGNERQRRRVLQILLDGGNSQRKIELVSRPGA